MIYREEHVKQLQALAKPGADELVYLGEGHFYDAKSFQLFQQAVAVDPSNGKALYRVARGYRLGRGTGKDEAQASRLFAEAFQQLQQQAEAVPSDAHAQYLLALCFFHGNGVTRDRAKAAVWFKQAAMQGHAEAQLSLGNRFRFGWGGAIDDVEGACWHAQAARQGCFFAKASLAELFLQNDCVLKDLTNRANKNRNDFVAYARANLVFLFQDNDSVRDELTKLAKTNFNDYLAASALAYIDDKGVVDVLGGHKVVVAANAALASHWKQRAAQCSESIPAEWLPMWLRPTP